MRAKKVIDFEEDMDPYKALKIGSHQDIEIGDKFELIHSIKWNHKSNEFILAKDIKPTLTKGTTGIIDTIFLNTDKVTINFREKYWNMSLDNIKLFLKRI